jgi:6-phosphofructokinase
MGMTHKKLGILVGGGPAPGINSVISAVTIEAVNSGLEVVGIYDGFEHLLAGHIDQTRPLSISDVSRIHFQGGSILRTSRANPTKRPEDLRQVGQTLMELGIGYLVTIGGDDTAFGASEVADASSGSVRVVHVPKTIDNDLPLPSGMPTFGFETARQVGTQVVLNLMEDSRTTNRWYLVAVMGRTAGHLALGIGNAAGATITIIPEEFSKPTLSLNEVSMVIEGAILKRRVMGENHGMVIVAEGIGAKLDPEELSRVPGVVVAHDPYGHIRLEEIPLASIIRREVQKRFAERGEVLPLVESTLGYGLRSAAPVPFDIDYTRTLGYGAVRCLMDDRNEELLHGAMICIEDGSLRALPLPELRDPTTGRTMVRVVDIDSDYYITARQYMIRLERRDLDDPEMLAGLAAASNMSEEDFVKIHSLGVS